jgi:hypothetical protein
MSWTVTLTSIDQNPAEYGNKNIFTYIHKRMLLPKIQKQQTSKIKATPKKVEDDDPKQIYKCQNQHPKPDFFRSCLITNFDI